MVELPLSRVVNRSFVPRYFPLTSPPGYNSLEINPNRGNSRAICLVRVHRTPSLARINFTFEIFRLWSLNSFPKYIFKLHISNVTSRFFLIFKLCIQLFSDIYKSSNRTNNFSLSLSPVGQVYISGTDSSRPSNYYYIHESVWNVVPPSGRSIPKIDQPK